MVCRIFLQRSGRHFSVLGQRPRHRKTVGHGGFIQRRIPIQATRAFGIGRAHRRDDIQWLAATHAIASSAVTVGDNYRGLAYTGCNGNLLFCAAPRVE